MPNPANFPISGTLILLGALAMTLGGAAMVLHGARMTNEAVLRRIALVRPSAIEPIHTSSLSEALVRSGEMGKHERETRMMVHLIGKIGLPGRWAAAVLIGVRPTAIATMAVLGYVVASHWPLLSGTRHLPLLVAVVLGLSGWFVPNMIFGRIIKRYTAAVVNGLPDALELLVICVEAGLSFEDGLGRIAVMLGKSQPALAGELKLTAADLKILPSRDVSLANLAARVDAPSVRTVVTTLAQTLRYGTPLSQALRLVASELRTAMLLRLQERANKMPALMTVPMMLFIMPTIFLIAAGPAILKVMDVFKH